MKEPVFPLCIWLCVLIPVLFVYGGLHAARKREERREPRAYFLKLLVLSIYVAGVFYFTGAGTLYNIRQYGMSPEVWAFSLAPFSAPSFDVTAYLLNVVLFLPLGFLLPLLWPAYGRFFRVLAAGAVFSLLIELSQMLNIRSTDIDDLLLNTLGAAAGFLLYRLYARMRGKRQAPPDGRGGEAALYLAAMFAGYFLLFNELGLAKMLYGF